MMSKNQMRFTGLLYVLVIVFAGLAQGFVRESIVVSGDASTTATNIINQAGLFRFGLISDLIAFLIDAVISVMFYQMLKPFGKTLAMVSSALRLLAHPAIGTLNLFHHYLALHVLNGADYLSVFESSQLEAMSLFFMDAHRNGYLIAGGFFGVHCALLGYQLIKSNLVPKFFGFMMMIAAVGYLTETVGDFMFPGNEVLLAWFVGISAAIGEVGFAFYLLIIGKRKSIEIEMEGA